MGTEEKYPLRVLFCNQCTTTQLDYTVPKETMFGDHTYRSGVTLSLNRHFEEVAQTVLEDCFDNQSPETVSVLDIGSNDGTQLRHFQAMGCKVLGVESSVGTAEYANTTGVPTICSFFNEELASQLEAPFQIINASGVFFHLEELHSVTRGIKKCLDQDGVFVVQFLYMKDIVENCAFDQIYHEHLLFYTLRTLSTLLARHGLAIFDCFHSAIHGGSMIAYVTHVDKRQASERLRSYIAREDELGVNTLAYYQAFAERVEELRHSNLRKFSEWAEQGKVVYGMGAPVKGNTLLNYLGIDSHTIRVLVEKNPLRVGLYSPGSHIPIVFEDESLPLPDVYYVLAWNFKDEILRNHRRSLDAGVEFYFPIDPSRRREIN